MLNLSVLLEDSAALAGIAIALAGTLTAVHLAEPRFDGLASIGIGLLLAVASIVIARESKGLLIGERADPALRQAILGLARTSRGVKRVNGLLTIQLAPDQVVAVLGIEFARNLTTQRIEAIVSDMESRLRAAHPEIRLVLAQPETARMGARRPESASPLPADLSTIISSDTATDLAQSLAQ